VLQRDAVRCSALHYICDMGFALESDTRVLKAAEKTTLQHTATHCNTLQHTATLDTRLLRAAEKTKDKEIDDLWKKMSNFGTRRHYLPILDSRSLFDIALQCNALQCTVMHCNAL